MCSPKIPDPPPIPPAPQDLTDEKIALAKDVQRDRQTEIFAGLSASIKNGPAGLLSPARTTAS
jgi:hypothetical protein